MLLEEIKLENKVIMSAFSSDVTNLKKSDRQQNTTDIWSWRPIRPQMHGKMDSAEISSDEED